jgi:ClpP class serine protease
VGKKMPSIHEIANNMARSQKNERRKHLSALQKHVKRNIICYYSNFLLSVKYGSLYATIICDQDMHGIMSTVHKLDKSIGLDLILQTPGGSATAAESIVTYLKSVFGKNIRAIVPHLAMSAGTMIACACKEIIMGKHSSLGPIDPQYGSTPAIDIITEFTKAKEEMSNNASSIPYWKTLLDKYPPAIYERCQKEIELAGSLAEAWLSVNMFEDNAGRAKEIVQKLNENANSKNHARHFDKEQCKKIGLKITDLENDARLQDIVLSIHHCYMYMFNTNTKISKIIENHRGISVTTQDMPAK